MSRFEQFANTTVDPQVRGFLHQSGSANSPAIALAHGASSNANSAVLVAIGDAFADAGFTVLRCDLPYRQDRRSGPPRPGDAVRDREGLKNAVQVLRGRSARAHPEGADRKVFLGGHSYGGRQATLLCADEPSLVNGLLLLSYPLHPPGKPAQLRAQHLPKLRTPCLFVHGTRDPFGSIAEMESALALIPAKHKLLTVEGAGHDVGSKGKSKNEELSGSVLQAFQNFFT